jgi:hypothetical protein
MSKETKKELIGAIVMMASLTFIYWVFIYLPSK